MDALAAITAQLNSSRVFAGVAMLMLNMGSRFVVGNMSPAHERLLSSALIRPLVLFCMLFVATRDVVTAACLATALILLAETVFNESSKYCLLPRSLLTAGAQPPSGAEYARARGIVSAYEEAVAKGAALPSMAHGRMLLAAPGSAAAAYLRASKAVSRQLASR